MVLLSVGFVVFLIVANEICEGEPVMGSDKIDAGVWSLTVMLLNILAPRQPICHLANLSLIAFPKTADGIAIFPIPFRPQDRKIPDLIPAFSHVPRFCD